MKNIGFSTKQGQEPVSIACLPGQVAAVRVTLAGGQPCLTEAVVRPAQGGSAEKLDAGCAALRVRRETVRLLLDTGEYQFLQTELPAVEAPELKNAVKWQVKDLLRFPVEQAGLEVMALPADTHMRRSSGFAVAAPNDIILDRMLRVRASRSRLVALDIPESAQRNIATAVEESGRATAVLSITENGGLLTVSRAGALYFTRSFDVSLSTLAASEDARRMAFDRLLLELQRTLDVLDRQFSHLSLSTLWLAPFNHRDDLLSLLIESLELPVRSIELEQIFHCAPEVLPPDLNEQGAVFFAMGLALHGSAAAEQKVNLVNPDLIPKPPAFPLHTQVIALSVIGAALLGMGLFARSQVQQLDSQAQFIKKQLDATTQRVNTLGAALGARKPDPVITQQLALAQFEQEELQAVAAMLRNGGGVTGAAGYSPHLLGLADQSVDGVWLTGFAFHAQQVDLWGMAAKADLLPPYLAALKRIPSLQGQTFEVLEMNESKTADELDQQKRPRATEFRLLATAAKKPGGQR